MKKLILLLLVASAFQFAQAQQSNKEKLIRKYIEVSGGMESTAGILDELFGTFEKMLPNVPAEFWTETKKEFKSSDFIDIVVPIYAKYFTEADLQEMIKFYETPVGKKLSANMANIMSDSMGAGQEYGKMVAQKVFDKLEKKGYKTN